MKRLDLLISIGAQKPFRLLHASDTHLCHADERDDERKNLLAEKRRRVFPNADENLFEISSVAGSYSCPVAYTGDLIDFVSEANLDTVRSFTCQNDVFMCAGNHEFSQYVGEAFEDKEYRNQSLCKVQAAFTNDIRMSARVINGIKLLAVDNSYYLFDREQLEFLKRECAEGLPAILLLHTPLFTPELHAFMIEERKQPCGYLCGSPEDLLKHYPPDRRRQQTPDRITLDVIEFIKNCGNINCILTGHIHTTVVSYIKADLPQYAIGLNEYCVISVY